MKQVYPTLKQLKALVTWRRMDENYLDLEGSKASVQVIKDNLKSLSFRDEAVARDVMPDMTNVVNYLSLWSSRFPRDRFYASLWIAYMNTYSNFLMTHWELVLEGTNPEFRKTLREQLRKLLNDNLNIKPEKMDDVVKYFMFKLCYLLPNYKLNEEDQRQVFSAEMNRLIAGFNLGRKIDLCNFLTIYTHFVSKPQISSWVPKDVVNRFQLIRRILFSEIMFESIDQPQGKLVTKNVFVTLSPKLKFSVPIVSIDKQTDKKTNKANKKPVQRKNTKTGTYAQPHRNRANTGDSVRFNTPERKPVKQYEYDGHKPRSVEEVVVRVKKKRTLTKPLGFKK